MDEVIQRLADELSARLDRSVEVDDRSLLPIAISAQRGPLDEVRINAVLQRHSSPEVVAHAKSFGILTATAPVRFPADDRLGTLPRLCIPIRDTGGARRGYLWLIDARPPLSDDEVAIAVDTAAGIAEEMRRTTRGTMSQLAVDRRLLMDLLGPDEKQRRAAAEQVEAESRLPSGEPLTVLVSRLAHCGDLAAVIPELTVARATGQVLLGWGENQVLLAGAAPIVERRLSMLRASLEAVAARQAFQVTGTGLGSRISTPAQLPAAYREAVYAARVAAADPDSEGFARWSHLGADLAFAGLAWTAETVEDLHSGAARLLEPVHTAIAETVLTYLACGCDTRVCAERLAIHRSTLYYRLDRARDILGHDWDDDADRLGLHLALRLGRLLRLDG